MIDFRNVVLTGFMGTGKTTVGRALAARLDYEFVDTDLLIELKAGKAVAAIFQHDGESVFRQWERVVSRQLAESSATVIATGGRLMLDADNAALLSARSHVFCLTAEPEEIVRRLAADSGQRPLLAGDNPAERVRTLLAERAQGYGQFPQIQTGGKSVDEVVEEVLKCISAT